MNFSVCENLPQTAPAGRENLVMGFHVPVLPLEVLEALEPREGATLLDGTLGGGGHSGLLLARGARVIGIDKDASAIASAREALSCYGDRFLALHGNFRDAPELLAPLGVRSLDGILLDIGISSHQIDSPGRGFSYKKNGPLDMRMDERSSVTAADILNNAPAAELLHIFREFGEEPRAARLASAIVRIRENRPFRTTFDLVAAIESVLHRHGGRTPCARIFQALRIAVNDELGALETALARLSPLLAPGGRLAVITFHSLEDRIVKRFFREHAREWDDRPEWPEPRRNPLYQFRILTGAPVVATPDETESNPRARSAKLRAVEKLATKEQP